MWEEFASSCRYWRRIFVQSLQMYSCYKMDTSIAKTVWSKKTAYLINACIDEIKQRPRCGYFHCSTRTLYVQVDGGMLNKEISLWYWWNCTQECGYMIIGFNWSALPHLSAYRRVADQMSLCSDNRKTNVRTGKHFRLFLVENKEGRAVYEHYNNVVFQRVREWILSCLHVNEWMPIRL